MANRATLHLTKLGRFQDYLEAKGYISCQTKGTYEALRMLNPSLEGPQRTVIVFFKGEAKEHFSVQDKDADLLRAFLQQKD
jgi:hypothetical protein